MDKATVSLLATLATVSLFLTSGRTVLQIHSTRMTGNVPFLPFLATFVNCSLWMAYGVVQHQMAVLVVNGIGMSLSLLYMSMFYHYAIDRAVLRQLLLYALAFLGFVAVYLWVADPYTRVIHLGLFCSCASIVMFGSPLSSLGEVVRTRDTSSLSFPLCFMNLLVSGLWFYYGYLLDDYFMMVPNGIGSMLAIAQLSLFAMFPSPAASAAVGETLSGASAGKDSIV